MDNSLTRSIADDFRFMLSGSFQKKISINSVAIALAAVDAYEFCESVTDPKEIDIKPIVEAACSRHKVALDTGCRLLVHLAAEKSLAQDCLLKMSMNKNSTARFNACAYINNSLPEKLRLEIVRRALNDRSAIVRHKGVVQAEVFKFMCFMPQLQEMYLNEQSKDIRRFLDVHIRLLRDGYVLEQLRMEEVII